MFVSAQKLILTLKLILILCAILFFNESCRQKTEFYPASNSEMPAKILWAWERGEDLRFLDSQKFGVAFLAQTLYLQNDTVDFRPRRQPLQVVPDTYLIAVTRVETDKRSLNRAELTEKQKEKVVFLIKKSLELPNVKAVQIDFDALVSERDFYRGIISELKNNLPENTPLSMTALASWCVGDAWFSDFKVDEAVPMIFDMGADNGAIRDFMANENDWREPLCRNSYGIAVDEPLNVSFKPNRRFFYFKSRAWEKSDLDKLE